MQLWGPQCIVARQSNYGDALTDIRLGMKIEWDECLQGIVRSNCAINPWGRNAKFLSLDQFMAEIVRHLKDLYNSRSSNVMNNVTREVTARNVVYFMRIKDELRRSMGVRKHGGNHMKLDCSGDVLALVYYLISQHITEFVIGRGKGEDKRAKVDCKDDLVEMGVERMNDGEWWLEYLLRSPRCASVLRGTRLGVLNSLDVPQYEGTLFE